jgi:hypothetical protein
MLLMAENDASRKSGARIFCQSGVLLIGNSRFVLLAEFAVGFFAEFYGPAQSSHTYPGHEVKKQNHGKTRRRIPYGRGKGGSAPWISETRLRCDFFAC